MNIIGQEELTIEANEIFISQKVDNFFSKYLNRGPEWDHYILHHDIFLWFIQNHIDYYWYFNIIFQNNVYIFDGITFIINNNKDAMMFKLIWG
jgi:hypothetical protein